MKCLFFVLQNWMKGKNMRQKQWNLILIMLQNTMKTMTLHKKKKEWIVTQDSWQMAVTKTLQICQKSDTNELLKNAASQICWIFFKMV